MQPTMATLRANTKSSSSSSVFDEGSLSVKLINVETSPKPLLIVAPITQGTYPVLLFFHGTCLQKNWYSQLLQHISSHGFIVVAPQDREVQLAGEVTDWLSTGLPSVLPEGVSADLDKLAVSGHSRGGKTAFALALGCVSTSLKFSGVIGVDPVAGSSPSSRTDPKILSYIPRSFNLSIPVSVFGTGLGDKPHGIIPPFAPDGVNHAEFFNESKPPCCYFLAKDYGHCDMLDDLEAAIASLECESGKGSKDFMRRGVGGIVVAFLKAYLEHESKDLKAIGDGSLIAPITLDPIILLED